MPVRDWMLVAKISEDATQTRSSLYLFDSVIIEVAKGAAVRAFEVPSLEPNSLREIKTVTELARRISASLVDNKMAASPIIVLEVIRSWLAGRRGPMLPGGSIGIATAVLRDTIETHAPGALSQFKDG